MFTLIELLGYAFLDEPAMLYGIFPWDNLVWGAGYTETYGIAYTTCGFSYFTEVRGDGYYVYRS